MVRLDRLRLSLSASPAPLQEIEPSYARAERLLFRSCESPSLPFASSRDLPTEDRMSLPLLLLGLGLVIVSLVRSSLVTSGLRANADGA